MLVKSIYVNDKLYNDTDDIKEDEMLKLCASVNHNVTKNDDKYMGDETEVAIYKYLESIGYQYINHLIQIEK